MATIATDGKGNYVTLDPSGNWVPTTAPATPQKGGGELGYQAAPPETKPASTDIGDITASKPGEADTPAWMSQQFGIDTSIQPGPNVASLLPFSVDPTTHRTQLAVPNAVRAILTQGPQVTDGKFSVPGATVDQGTGELGLTPEATAGGMLIAGGLQGGLRFSGQNALMREPVSPMTLTKPPPVTLPELNAAIARADEQPPPNRLAPGGSATQPPPPEPEPPAAPTPAAPADPPIMSQADIRARGHGYFNVADQAASQGAMLPDTNAAAVRKLFGDFIPGDPEAARISAGEPAMQAAKNVDATGPMSYDTAIRIDRDLTSRMRGASGTDAHDLSQLQQSLRDQMDQVPDLENLRLGRQAWKQSIKQGQMEDINAGAALKNDPAQGDTYVRQRAAALLKNPNAMRYWTPEEQAQLTQVAQSGDIGMVGRLTTSLIKPISRVAFGAAGHLMAGPLGAIVGAEVGGDVGATAASKVRSYMSPTNLDPVMEQITRGVPPPNRLGPQTTAP